MVSARTSQESVAPKLSRVKLSIVAADKLNPKLSTCPNKDHES
jgi:predicted component of type VI protein secretion system